jgi:imidazolonepropionase-like amidohydrolase
VVTPTKTIEGPQAIGLGDEVGSWEVDKQADLVLVERSPKFAKYST